MSFSDWFILAILVIGVCMAASLIALMVAFVVFIGPLLIYWIWPLVIPAVFPGAVEQGFITGQIGFWNAVGLSIICHLLFTGTSSSSD